MENRAERSHIFYTKKIAAVVAVGALAFSCVAGGCALQNDASGDTAQSAAEVYERYMANPHDHYNMNGSIDISMQASGVSAAVPVSFSFDINGVSSHGIMSMDLMGQQSTVETYVVPDNEVLLGYFKTDTNGEAGSWTVSELDANAMSQFADFDSSMFENAQLTVSDSGYTVTMNAADMLGYLQNLGVNEKNTTTRGFADMFGSYKDALSGLTINCDFDKDCNLVGISIPTYQGELEMEGQKADITISCDIVISGQGTVAEITVPEDVVKAADNLPSDISGADDTESASVESTES